MRRKTSADIPLLDFDTIFMPEIPITHRGRLVDLFRDYAGYTALATAGAVLASSIGLATYDARKGARLNMPDMAKSPGACGGATSFTQGFIDLSGSPQQFKKEVDSELADLQSNLRNLPHGSTITATNPFSISESDVVATLSANGGVTLSISNEWFGLGHDTETVPFDRHDHAITTLGGVACQGDDGYLQKNGFAAEVWALYASANNIYPSDPNS